MFQNCAILDSNKTVFGEQPRNHKFQNCAILDSNKTNIINTISNQIVLELCYFRQ